MRAASKFEKDVLVAIGNRFPEQLCNLKAMIETLNVAAVESTGVGAYVRFDRRTQAAMLSVKSGQFGFDGEIEVENVKSGLGAVLDISESKFNHLEFFTYGDEYWDGNTLTDSFVVRSRVK